VRISADGVVKEGYGSSKIRRQRESKEIIDLGNDIKAACTQALKKSAAHFGAGLHLCQDTDALDAGTATHEAVSGAESHAQYSNAGRQHTQQHQPQQQNQPYNTAQHTNSAPPDQRSISTGRLSGKQHAYLLKLAQGQGMSKRELSNYCQQRYGVVLDFLSRQDASALIDQLRQGNVPYTGDAA